MKKALSVKDTLKLALEFVASISPAFICEATHHKKNEEHASNEPCPHVKKQKQTYEAIKEALAQLEQEPVAWRFQSPVGGWAYRVEPPIGFKYAVEPLYTTPPQTKEPEQEQVSPMSEPNRAIAYAASGKLHELGYRYLNGEWVQPKEPEHEPVAKYSDIVSDGGLDPRNTTPPNLKPKTDEMRKQMKERCDSMEMRGAFADGWLSAEAAHGIKEQL